MQIATIVQDIQLLHSSLERLRGMRRRSQRKSSGDFWTRARKRIKGSSRNTFAKAQQHWWEPGRSSMFDMVLDVHPHPTRYSNNKSLHNVAWADADLALNGFAEAVSAA